MTQSEKRLFLIQSLLKERSEYRRVETPRDSEGQRQLLRGLMNVRPPQAADPDFLRVQDAYLQAETAAPSPPAGPRSRQLLICPANMCCTRWDP